MDNPIQHILVDEDGVPRTINGRVQVKMIAQKHLFAGERVEDIADHYGISRADVYAALAYYYDNLACFEQRERELQPLIEEAERYSAELKAKILQRMQQRDQA
jgi:uncharacterized protein (DUF433 family)